MGQQQLLLVILVTIIVGIATVVAINTFGSAADNANVDAVRNDMVQMAAAAQSHYYVRPAALGGGDNKFTNVTFKNMGAVPCKTYSNGDKDCTNANGTYKLTSITASGFTITGTPAQAGGSIAADVTKDNVEMGDYTGS